MLDQRFDFRGTKNFISMSPESLSARDDFLKFARDIRDLEEQGCYLCKEDSFEAVSKIDRYGFFYPTALCKNCGNIQQSHYYSENTLIEFYSNYYRQIYGNMSPTELYESQKNLSGQKIFDIVSKLKRPETVLEIGCGAGGILEVFKAAGSDVLGLDFDEDYLDAARSRNIPVKRGSIEVLNENEKFDLIILSHVLEHIVEPAEFLKKLRDFLSEDGILYIEVPSVDLVTEGAYGYDLLKYFQNAHTIHFTTKTLELMCKTVGLRPLYQTNFIESCWARSEFESELTASELSESVKFSEHLLSLAEQRRRSIRTTMLIYGQKIKRSVGGILSAIGLKDTVKNILRKLKS